MKFLSYIKIITAAFVLGIFVFNFLHTELGFLSHHEEIEHCVDFCKIIDGSGNPSVQKNTPAFYKVKVDFTITDNIICGVQKEVSFLTDFNTLKYLQKTNKVYLHNNTFLI